MTGSPDWLCHSFPPGHPVGKQSLGVVLPFSPSRSQSDRIGQPRNAHSHTQAQMHMGGSSDSRSVRRGLGDPKRATGWVLEAQAFWRRWEKARFVGREIVDQESRQAGLVVSKAQAAEQEPVRKRPSKSRGHRKGPASESRVSLHSHSHRCVSSKMYFFSR